MISLTMHSDWSAQVSWFDFQFSGGRKYTTTSCLRGFMGACTHQPTSSSQPPATGMERIENG